LVVTHRVGGASIQEGESHSHPITTALEELDRADRGRLAAQLAYEAAERAVFAAIGREIGPVPGVQGLDVDIPGLMPETPESDALDHFLSERSLENWSITYRDAMWRARDESWIAGRDAEAGR
jgi:hypothetical protein